jgi:hypothetical protein
VSLSGDGNTVVIGAPADNSNVGAAWVFVRSNGVWTQKAKLVGSGGIFTPGFSIVDQGYSVGISAAGNTIISGAPDDDEGVGAVWVFKQQPVVLAELPER